jgi:CheY-like chemotaxis protein
LKLEQSFLQRDEIDILTARNGKEAYDLISLHQPDLVLLDMYMPEMNGDECCRRIKSQAELRHIPVIMVTAGEEDHQDQCRDAGCDDIILKPFDREAFVGTVQKFLKVTQRADVRSPLKMEVKYGPGQLLTGYSFDLSVRGMFLATENLLSLEASLSLNFISRIRPSQPVVWEELPG